MESLLRWGIENSASGNGSSDNPPPRDLSKLDPGIIDQILGKSEAVQMKVRYFSRIIQILRTEFSDTWSTGGIDRSDRRNGTRRRSRYSTRQLRNGTYIMDKEDLFTYLYLVSWLKTSIMPTVSLSASNLTQAKTGIDQSSAMVCRYHKHEYVGTPDWASRFFLWDNHA